MDSNGSPQSEPAFRIERDTDASGVSALRVSGRLALRDGGALHARLQRELALGSDALRIDLAGVERLDGGSAALLLAARAEARERGRDVDFAEAPQEASVLLGRYGCPSEFTCLRSAPRSIGTLDHVGRATVRAVDGLKDILDFVGDLASSLAAAVRSPRTVRWRDVGGLMERSGADGVPIVLLINFLVGLIMGLQAAEQLRRFGADIFVADLVGLSVTRELGPLMTAIIVAGRSGAAFAAELGTMRVSEEVDALRSLRLDPLRHLVFPRVIALMAVVPILTLGADVVGCVGGLFVALYSLDLTMVAYVTELKDTLDVWDVFGGLIKSAVFAATITLISCQRGLATRGGAAGVGTSTTTAVVAILFALIVWDALFTLLYNALGI